MMRRVVLALALAACVLVVSAQEYLVQLDSGLIRGEVTDTARAFRGIPYAAPPIGALRWADTQPVTPWGGILDATEDRAGCIQKCVLPAGARACPASTSEDCLFITVYTPRVAAMPAPAAVMVFFHGGNFHQGHGGGPIYNGTLFTNASDVILVSVNYRLGALGFLAADVSTGIDGNYGIRDQIFALEWVQRNVAAFGGDPNSVTIFGQSAGATSVVIHLTAPSTIQKKLFHRAIVMSSPITLPLRDATTMPALANAFATDIGCALTDAVCLRGKNASAVLASQLKTMNDLAADPKVILAFMPWEPYVDGNLIVSQPFVALSNGAYDTSIPVVVGNVRQEAVVFIYSAYGKPMTGTGLAVLLELILGTKGMIDTLFKYPVPSGSTDVRMLASQIGTDYIFLCSNRNMTRAMSAFGTVYNYVFDHVPSFNQTAWAPESECYTAVCHGVDLPFTFDSAQPYVQYDDEETTLTQSMVQYYTSFARTGVPSDAGSSLAWPAYTPSTSETMYFQTPANEVVPFFLDSYCGMYSAAPATAVGVVPCSLSQSAGAVVDFWDGLGYGY